jgi:hypothetical protein
MISGSGSVPGRSCSGELGKMGTNVVDTNLLFKLSVRRSPASESSSSLFTNPELLFQFAFIPVSFRLIIVYRNHAPI